MLDTDSGLTRRRFLRGAGQTGLVAGLALGGVTAAAGANPSNVAHLIERADALFIAGRFRRANELYERVLQRNPGDVHALAQHAYYKLLVDDLHHAKILLKRVLRRDATHARARSNLAAALWRRDELEELAELLPTISESDTFGRPSATVAQLESFAGLDPYDISGPSSTSITFLTTDPLPMVEVSVNGADPVVFYVDTGGTFYMSAAYAAEADIPLYGTTTEIFAGGIEAEVEHGRADVVTLGDMQVENVPVNILPSTGPGSEALQAPDGRFTQGALGTSVLSHFIPTIDYVGGKLVLRRRGGWSPPPGPGAITTPMWFTGDHFLLGRGTVNDVGPMTFLVDTGGAGLGFTAPNATFAAAGIAVPPEPGFHLVNVDSLTLGDASGSNILGVTGAFPEALEMGFGFQIGGLVTHSFFTPFALTFDFDHMRFILD